MLLRIKTRFLVAAVVLVGLTAGGAGSYVRGSQEPAEAGDGQAKTTIIPKSPRQSQTPPAPDDLVDQRFAVRKAEAHYEIARQNRVLVEIDLEEFGVTKERYGYDNLDKVTIEGEIKLAESDLATAKDNAERAERMFEKKDITRVQKVIEQLNLQKAQFALEQATSKRDVLERFVIPRAESLKSKLSKAHDEEKSRRVELDREKAKQAEMERSDEENFKRPKGGREKAKKTELERSDRQPE